MENNATTSPSRWASSEGAPRSSHSRNDGEASASRHSASTSCAMARIGPLVPPATRQCSISQCSKASGSGFSRAARNGRIKNDREHEHYNSPTVFSDNNPVFTKIRCLLFLEKDGPGVRGRERRRGGAIRRDPIQKPSPPLYIELLYFKLRFDLRFRVWTDRSMRLSSFGSSDAWLGFAPLGSVPFLWVR